MLSIGMIFDCQIQPQQAIDYVVVIGFENLRQQINIVVVQWVQLHEKLQKL